MYSDVAREGRKNQLYSESGARIVAGTVILNKEKTQVFMIGSSTSKKWILPKGGAELDEKDDYSAAAVRETWEEAGVKGKIVKYLGLIPHSKLNRYPIRSEFHFYEMEFETAEDEWPESSFRKRKWMAYEEAKKELIKAERFELADALEKSSIIKPSSDQ